MNSANALFVPLLRSGAASRWPCNVDGIEKRRAKWGAFGRAVYALSERLACVVPDALVTDAEVIRRHYLERYGAESVPIAYGVDPRPPAETGVLGRVGSREPAILPLRQPFRAGEQPPPGGRGLSRRWAGTCRW